MVPKWQVVLTLGLGCLTAAVEAVKSLAQAVEFHRVSADCRFRLRPMGRLYLDVAGATLVRELSIGPGLPAVTRRPVDQVFKMAKKAAKKKVARKAVAKTAAKASRPKSTGLTDNQLVKAIIKRVAEAASDYKKRADQGESIFDPVEEQKLWSTIRDANAGAISDAALQAIFREILSSARNRVQPVRVAYLGPPFSFTHLAALERFGRSADLVPVDTISSVFEEVNRGHCDFGVVPIENSTDGRIVDTLDMFTRLPLRICGEVQMRIHHHLLSRSPRSEIVEIYSKPQALSQCRDWLARNMPGAVKHAVTSTSTAAQLAHDKPGAAAVASRQAAVQYDLNILAESIEDNTHNVTRFAVIGDQEPAPTDSDRTSLLLQISHKPGALSDALAAFKQSKVNLTWIESFPLRGSEDGAYLFFLDCEGHRQDPKLKKVLTALEKMAVRMEVLGSYPRSEPTPE